MTRPSDYQNGDSIAYWQGAVEGRLMFQRCKACGVVQFPPRHHCSTCWHEELDWVQSSGQGTVESVTVVHRAPTAAFREKAPYVVAAVLIEEGPRMITNIIGPDAHMASIGDAVSVVFEPDAKGNVLPQFRKV